MDGPVGHGSVTRGSNCVDWHQRHIVRIFPALCLPVFLFTTWYTAFVAAVVAMVSNLA